MDTPKHLSELIEKAYLTMAALVHSLGRIPAVEEFAAELQIDNATAELVLKNLPQAFSLDDYVGDNLK